MESGEFMKRFPTPSMMQRRTLFLIGIFIFRMMTSTSPAQSGQDELLKFMPKPKDHTSLWWKDGFPGTAPDAPWRRIKRTGRYWFMLDTDSMKIPRIGSIDGPVNETPGADLALTVRVDGKNYICRKSREWSRFTGPRLIESGRFLQRTDVTDLILTSDDGTPLNAETRFESAAWPDQLGLSFFARPGYLPLTTGERSFGRVNGGFGLDENTRFEIPADQCRAPGNFTLAFWVFPPNDFKAGKHDPWLVSKNRNELGEGSYGIVIHRDGIPSLRFNIGGGKENVISPRADRRHALKVNEWNHLAINYDGDHLRLYVNGQVAIEEKVGIKRVAPAGGLTFGGRQDGSKNYPFHGVVDEIHLFERALGEGEIRRLRNAPEADHSGLKPVHSWTFRKDIPMSATRLRDNWQSASVEIAVTCERGTHRDKQNFPKNSPDWRQASIRFDPVTFKAVPPNSPISITAIEKEKNEACPVSFDPSVGWHRINLDGIEPIPPPGEENPSNDAIERVRLILSNPTDSEQIARLMFEKTARGIHQKIGVPITGMTAMLRDAEGNPTGIPVQLSKNWHYHPEAGALSGPWFHGISRIRLPAKQKIELELTLAYGNWGGVPAASHAQLSLIGWGNNQLWDQSALGSWGESICYEPEQGQAGCTITDVRPVMVTSMSERSTQWNWTKNVGGGDFFRLFDRENQRVPHTRMRAEYHRTGPCLTEVTYRGNIGQSYGLNHRATVSLSRRDDVICGTYQLRLDVTEPVDFSRFVIFQTGADTYATTREKKLAVGVRTGLVKEWNAQWGGNTYRGEPIECTGPTPWASLHETTGNPDEDKPGAWANRGFVIRHWKARLGGKDALPWIAEHGLDVHPGKQSSTLDIIPPPGIERLEPGDFVEATIEHIVVPQFAADYYGPNAALRAALKKDQNTWKMIQRQADGDHLKLDVRKGTLAKLYPGVQIMTDNDEAEFDLQGGLGYTPVTFMNLSKHSGYTLTVDGEPLDQSVHGGDFWQTDFDPDSGTWSQTYNVAATSNHQVTIKFDRNKKKRDTTLPGC